MIDADVVALHLLLCAVEDHRSGIAGDGNNHALYGSDLQAAVGDHKGHIKVLVVVDKLACCQTHGIRTHIGLFYHSAAVKAEISLGIQGIADGNGIALYLLGSAVVNLLIAVAGDGHGDLQRIDLQFAVGDVEDHILKIGVGILKLLCLQAHSIGAHIGAGCHSAAGECKVFFLVQAIADADIVAAHLLLVAVVDLGSLMTGDGDHHAALGGDLQFTVGNVKGDGKVIILICELLCLQAHGIGAHCSTLHHSAAAEAEVSFFVQAVADGNIIAFCRMLAAVINDGFLRTGDGNVHSQRGDLHLAVHIVHLELLGYILAGVVQNLGSAGHHVHILAHISAGNQCADVRNGKALGQTGGGIAGNALCAAVINKCAAVAGDGDLTLLGILCHISHVIGDLGADHGAPADEVMICIGGDQGCNGGSAVLLDLAVHNLTVLVLAGQGTVITVVINDGVTGGNAAHAGNGELIFLAVHGQDGDLVGGMIHVLIKAFCVGIQLDAIGHGIDIGGGAVRILGAILILQRPGQVAGIANNAGRQIHSGGSDSNVVTHGIVDHDIFNAFGNILGNGAECSHQTGGIVGIVSKNMLALFISICRRCDALLQIFTDSHVNAIISTAGRICIVIRCTKANGIQLCAGILDIGCIIHRSITVCLGIIINTAVSDTCRRRAVRQQHHALAGYILHTAVFQQFIGSVQCTFQVGTGLIVQTVNGADSSIIRILTFAAGYIDPVHIGSVAAVKGHDCQHSAGRSIHTCITGLAAGTCQELDRSRLGCSQTILCRSDTITLSVIVLAVRTMVVSLSAFCAALHRAGYVDDQHNSRCTGLHHGLGDGLNLQRDIEHIVRHLLGGLAQIQSKQIAHLIGKLAFAALLPLAILIVIAIGHSRKFFLPGCPNSRHGQIQNHNHCQKQRQETFSHKNSSFS